VPWLRCGRATRWTCPNLTGSPAPVPDARAIGDSLAAHGVRLSLGGSVYDLSDPMGKCFFNILATFAEFAVDLSRMRTREGMAIARAKGRLKGKAPKLSCPADVPAQAARQENDSLSTRGDSQRRRLSIHTRLRRSGSIVCFIPTKEVNSPCTDG
jgi:DNA invertase Pin-like site-specific DNA recombinase